MIQVSVPPPLPIYQRLYPNHLVVRRDGVVVAKCSNAWAVLAALQRYCGWGTTHEEDVTFDVEAIQVFHRWMNSIRVYLKNFSINTLRAISEDPEESAIE